MPNCLTCNTEFSFNSKNPKKKFCSISCAATFNNTGRVRTDFPNGVYVKCLGCGDPILLRGNESRKFCSNSCQQNYEWLNIYKPKVILGKGNIGTCKRFLIETYGETCCICGQGTIWNNKPLTLHLDHIDGNSDNWAVINIRLLCPHCHSQTETFGSKGSGSTVRKDTTRNKYLRKHKGYEC